MKDDVRRKVYVEVISKTDTLGKMEPLSFKWEDGTVYEVDEVKDVRRAASLKAGGVGLRFQIRIGNHDTFLFYEDLEPCRWFIEGK